MPDVAKARSIVLVVVSDVAKAGAIVVFTARVVLHMAETVAVMTPHLSKARAVVTLVVPDVARAGSTFERMTLALSARG